jgi:predicted secreted protein
MTTALRPLLVLALAAALTSCGGDDPSTSASQLDSAVAARLAKASENVAAALDEHGCAETEVRELERQASGANVPIAVRREVRRVVERAHVACPVVAPPPPIPIPTVGADDDEGHGHGKHKDKKKKKKHDDEGDDD